MGSPDPPPCALTAEMLSSEAVVMVKPSQPSPSTAILELSNFDQMLNFYISAILFYSAKTLDDTNYSPPCGQTKEVALVVKCALQELLTDYPAAAGRLRLNPSQKRLEVECNDDGVQFVSVHADMPFSDLGDVSLAHPALDLLFPTIPSHPEERPPIVAMQVTSFKCGGFTLAIKNNHAYLDGHSAAIFLHNLASIARGDGISIAPDTVSRQERLKPKSPPIPAFDHPFILKEKNAATFTDLALLPPERYGHVTRISFCTSALERLRCDSLLGHNYFKACSRYQALIALLWKAKARSLLQTQAISNHVKLPIRIPIDLRRGLMPGLTQNYVGNGTFLVIVSASIQELCESALYLIVLKIQQAIYSVTPMVVQSMLDHIECGGGPLESYCDPSFFGMATLVGLPFYDTNFGWGYPNYCGFPSAQLNNRLYILHGGLQASEGWNVLVVLESDMERQIFLETLANHVTFST